MACRGIPRPGVTFIYETPSACILDLFGPSRLHLGPSMLRIRAVSGELLIAIDLATFREELTGESDW